MGRVGFGMVGLCGLGGLGLVEIIWARWSGICWDGLGSARLVCWVW